MLHALNTRVLVKPDDKEVKTESGIFIPDNANNKDWHTGTVVSVGGQVKETQLKPGCRVAYPALAFIHEFRGDKYVYLDIFDVIGYLDE